MQRETVEYVNGNECLWINQARTSWNELVDDAEQRESLQHPLNAIFKNSTIMYTMYC